MSCIPTNHCFEVGLEKQALRRHKSVKLSTSEEKRSASRNAQKIKYNTKCVVIRKNVRKLSKEMLKRLFSKPAVPKVGEKSILFLELYLST